MLALIIAGEVVFGLPFHTARFFRPTLLEVFGFTNTQLGDLFAVYGITAMISYFPGGALADRYPARTLLTLSLRAFSMVTALDCVISSDMTLILAMICMVYRHTPSR